VGSQKSVSRSIKVGACMEKAGFKSDSLEEFWKMVRQQEERNKLVDEMESSFEHSSEYECLCI
jgi:hypothetical protein